ncbi:MAG: 50S ribosomal protein L6 [Candidatus Woesearchaeota archaeon]
MTKKDLIEKIIIPEGISVSKEGNFYTFKYQKAVVSRKFDNPKVNITLNKNEIDLVCKSATKKDKAVFQSYLVHLKNIFEGLKQPYKYTLKICSGHFPMNVSVANGNLIVKNFLGEKIPRQLKLKENVTVKVDGNLIHVESHDKELAGQVSADIERITRRPGFDRRIFQDGIYLIEKSGEEI